jgi:hypothetical protein
MLKINGFCIMAAGSRCALLGPDSFFSLKKATGHFRLDADIGCPFLPVIASRDRGWAATARKAVKDRHGHAAVTGDERRDVTPLALGAGKARQVGRSGSQKTHRQQTEPLTFFVGLRRWSAWPPPLTFDRERSRRSRGIRRFSARLF